MLNKILLLVLIFSSTRYSYCQEKKSIPGSSINYQYKAPIAVGEFKNYTIRIDGNNWKELPIGNYISVSLTQKLLNKKITLVDRENIDFLLKEDIFTNTKYPKIGLEYGVFGEIKNFGFDEKSPREKLESPDGKYWLKLEISVKITRRDSIIVFYDTVSLKTTTNKNTIETLFGKNIAKDMAKEMLTTAVFNPGVSILMKAMSLTKIIRGVKAGNFINPSVSPSEPTNEKDWNDSLASQILDEATTKLADKISNEIQNLTKKVFFTFEKIKWEEYKEISKELQNLTKFHIDANYEEDKTDIHCLINLNEQDDILSKIVNSKLIKNMNLKLKSESGSNLYFRKKTDKEIASEIKPIDSKPKQTPSINTLPVKKSTPPAQKNKKK